MEEQKAGETLELVQKKHKLIKWEGERQRLEASRQHGLRSTTIPLSFGSCSSSLAFNTDEAISASSQAMKEAVEKAGGASTWR